MSKNQQLSSVDTYNVAHMTFSEAKETTIPGSYRITIGTQYPNGSVGPLIFSTDEVYSFGLQENTSMDKPVRTTGYTIPLCLWNSEGPTAYQKNFITTIRAVCEHVKAHVLRPEVKKSVKKFDLVESDLRKFTDKVVVPKRGEDGEVVADRGPMLYPKLMCDKNLQIYTVIADPQGNDIDPMQLIGQKCVVRACIKIDSLFIGSKISLQVKVLELEVQQSGNQRQRLLCRAPPQETVTIASTDVLNPLAQETLVASDDSDDESEEESDTEMTAPVVAPVKPTPPAPASRKRLAKN